MQAITATFLPATNKKPARIKVQACSDSIKSKIYSYCCDTCESSESAEKRIVEYAKALGWISHESQLAFGSIENGNKIVGVIK